MSKPQIVKASTARKAFDEGDLVEWRFRVAGRRWHDCREDRGGKWMEHRLDGDYRFRVTRRGCSSHRSYQGLRVPRVCCEDCWRYFFRKNPDRA